MRLTTAKRHIAAEKATEPPALLRRSLHDQIVEEVGRRSVRGDY